MFISPYETTYCRNAITAKVAEEIAKHRNLNTEQFKRPQAAFLKDDDWCGSVVSITPGLADIPPFAHPFTLTATNPHNNTGKDNYSSRYEPVYIDVRNFTRLTQDGDVKISAPMDYNLACLRGFLQAIWRTEHYSDVLNTGNIQITIFARWLSELFTKRLALDPQTQMNTAVLCAYYYLCLFVENDIDELHDDERQRFATMIARSTYVNVEDVLRIVGDTKILRDLSELLTVLKEKGGSARFEGINPAFVYSATGGTWFGAGSSEIVAVALEHPPTFVAMLNMALTERGYRNTILGNLGNQYKKADEIRSFLYNVTELCKAACQ